MDLSIFYSPTEQKPRHLNGFHKDWLLENIRINYTLKIILVSDAAT